MHWLGVGCTLVRFQQEGTVGSPKFCAAVLFETVYLAIWVGCVECCELQEVDGMENAEIAANVSRLHCDWRLAKLKSYSHMG